MVDAETIAKQARKSIGQYCYEECKAYCCRKGFLVMDKKQAELITDNKLQEYLDNGSFKILKDGMYSMDMKKTGMACPRLKNFKCTIHNNRNRPKPCKEFPLFLFEKTIRLSARCPAVRENKLYPYIARLVKMGYKLEKAEWYSDLDLHSLNFEHPKSKSDAKQDKHAIDSKQ